MTDKKIRIHLGDQSTLPTDIGWEDLKFVIDRLRAAIVSRCKEKGEVTKDKLRFALVALDSGSVIPTLEFEGHLANAATDISRAIEGRDLAPLSVGTADHLYQIERRLCERNVPWTVTLGRRRPARSKFISGERPLPQPSSLIEGWTTLYGECVRAGGMPPKIRLRIQDDRTLSVPCSRRIAQQAATRLYRIIALKGRARWRPEDMSVVDFRAEEWIPYKGEALEQSIRLLREVAGEPWRGRSVVETYKGLHEDD